MPAECSQASTLHDPFRPFAPHDVPADPDAAPLGSTDSGLRADPHGTRSGTFVPDRRLND